MANNKYNSVLDMVREISDDPKFADDFEQDIGNRWLVKKLIAIRTARGVSQKEIAERLQWTPSKVSKLENGDDDDIRLGDLRDYTESINIDLGAILAKK